MPSPPGATAKVAEFGERIFGKEWGAAMARLTGVNLRTIDRIKAAHAAGVEYPAAGGALDALHTALVAVIRDLAPYARPGA
jgi:hypothetical protein